MSALYPNYKTSPTANRRHCRYAVGFVFCVLAFFSGRIAAQTGEDSDGLTAPPGAEYLTRGPLHEAFSQVIVFDPQPGLIVPKEPPPAIEELPPDERPEGDNIFWIPGYWAWDDESNDFIWISGIWRAVPPDRQWVPGYWDDLGGQYQWVSGYWASAEATEQTYLPQPPASLERGPSSPQPADDSLWMPGHWQWQTERYFWTPGYWETGRPDWVWIPSRYVWTPSGWVFVGGYWDYSPDRCGVVFAPVRYVQPVYRTPGYRFQPLLTISISLLTDHLFLRPRSCHYYYGDYYAPSYSTAGYYPQNHLLRSPTCYDPIFTHLSYSHRTDVRWIEKREATYVYYRDHSDVRPPSTWSNFRHWPQTGRDKAPQRYAMPLTALAKAHPNYRLTKVNDGERQRFVDQSRVVREAREHLAAKTHESGRPGFQPGHTAKLPQSPIVVRSRDIPDSARPPKTRPKLSEQPPIEVRRPEMKRPDVVRPGEGRPPSVIPRPSIPGGPSKAPGRDRERETPKPSLPSKKPERPSGPIAPSVTPKPPSKEVPRGKEMPSRPEGKPSQTSPGQRRPDVSPPKVIPKPPSSRPTPQVVPDRKPTPSMRPSQPERKPEPVKRPTPVPQKVTPKPRPVQPSAPPKSKPSPTPKPPSRAPAPERGSSKPSGRPSAPPSVKPTPPTPSRPKATKPTPPSRPSVTKPSQKPSSGRRPSGSDDDEKKKKR